MYENNMHTKYAGFTVTSIKTVIRFLEECSSNLLLLTEIYSIMAEA